VSEGTEPYDISIEVDPPYAGEVDLDVLTQIATSALRHQSVQGPLELGIWITNETEIQTLNRTYRGVDASTDVLSFGTEDDEGGFVSPPESVRQLGDIAISFPHVVRQAEEYGHSRQRELAYLLVHGILHLLGYDHEDPAEAPAMRRHEEDVLVALGITRNTPHHSDQPQH